MYLKTARKPTKVKTDDTGSFESAEKEIQGRDDASAAIFAANSLLSLDSHRLPPNSGFFDPETVARGDEQPVLNLNSKDSPA